ncbi:hypothetical protein ABZ604_31405 [Streptomyces sp. NPDC012473]|uniref:hypothetical protein n=1 Tax=Streptomyces sp. NPDC012473 TaxID=3156676 RepID=UPI0033EA596F
MTRPPASKSSRALIATAGLLATAGCALLLYALPPQDKTAPPHSTASPIATHDTALPSAGATSPAPAEPSWTPGPVEPAEPTAPPASSPPAVPDDGALPEPGAGPRADPLVQRALEQAIAPDLAPAEEAELAMLGRRVWMAEVTGAGRVAWPAYFPDADMASRYSRVRIQGLIARADPDHRSDAVVHLVWAGADPSGTFLDGRTATVRFARRGSAWMPTR